MKTLKKGFSIRLMSVILTVLMLFSVFSAGIVSTSAATVDVVETDKLGLEQTQETPYLWRKVG